MNAARISVVGLGKLGAPLAAVLASNGHSVIGVDADSRPVDKIAAGVAPVSEPGLQDLIDRHRSRISATIDLPEAIGSTDVTFIVVPTPSGPDGGFVNDHVLSAVDRVGRVLSDKRGDHLVVVTSTVMPGAMAGHIAPQLERSSARRLGEGLSLCYNPEFIALGNVIEGLLNPDLILVGTLDPRAGDQLEALRRTVAGSRVPVARMSFINAEITKISINAYLTTKISFANMLSEICREMTGADVDVVTDALGLDGRIGRKFLRGATAYGGPCFPRDTVAFAKMARDVGVSADIPGGADAVNRRQTERLSALIAKVATGRRIALLGLAYKAGTPVIEESAGIDLARSLGGSGFDVVVYDPLAIPAARALLGDAVAYAGSADEAVAGAHAIAILTPDPEFGRVAELTPAVSTPVVDCWGILAQPVSSNLRIIRLGRGEIAPDQ